MDNLVDKLIIALDKKSMMLACAESCTGGMIAAAITERAGSSRIFDRGFVTYSNESKTEMLGVDKLILTTHGAVSAECAKAMVKGALKCSRANIAAAVTGIAGPSGGSTEKPVGLVYIAIALHNKEPQVFECHFTGSRAQIRESAVHFTLEKLIETVERTA